MGTNAIRYTLVIAALFLLNMAYCVEIDSVTAKSAAKNFYLSRLYQSNLNQSKQTGNEIELVLVHQENINSSKTGIRDSKNQPRPIYYVFNVKNNNGFIIVSGDDRAVPVLGYAFAGCFSVTDQAPAFSNWLVNYSEQIKYLIEKNPEADSILLMEWSRLTGAFDSNSAAKINEVPPLLTTTWNQGCYYNEYCPADSDGPCNHTYAGCVAVAMAQIMKYWNHPESSNKISGFNTGLDFGCIPDIEKTQYDWSSMPDNLTSESPSYEKDIVSELLFNFGVATQMNFSSDGSGANSRVARNALVSYFKYSSSTEYLDRSDYPDNSEWEDVIKAELDSSRPVYYGGFGSGGHAFVCDGYQNSNYFHINWGWSGIYNGYFYLSDLTPGFENFNDNQCAIVGIYPGENQPDPFDHMVEIGGCGPDYSHTFMGGGAGAWDLSNCMYSTPGLEQVYSFIAPVSGFYSIEVSAASGDMGYSWRIADCGDPGWSCIEGIGSEGTYGSYYWTAGTQYLILLDNSDTDASIHQFYMNCPIAVFPIIEYESHEIDDDNINSSGDNDGRAEPGESIEMPVTLRNTGTGDAHNVSAILSTPDPYIIITDSVQSWGLISAGSTDTSVDYDFEVSPDCPEKDVTFTLEISSDENSWTDQFTVHIYEGGAGPCDNILLIDGCGSESTRIFSGGGTGQWNATSCGDSAPGLEQVYQFIAPVSGIYHIEVTEAGGYMDYSWRTSGCGETGWICIESIGSTGTYGSFSWMAGNTYNILLDDKDTMVNPHQFFITCPDTASPIIEYFNHEIDDSSNAGSGDNDGLVEPGESIGMSVGLKNTGNGEAHHVSAVLSTSDPYISMIGDLSNFGDISPGGSASGSEEYGFYVEPDCPERDITFTLDITSDELNWTDRFTLHIYEARAAPCDHIILINGCGSDNARTFEGGGSGAWSANNCGYNTPGLEQVYQFTAPVSGIYNIEVTDANGYMDYGWKASGCSESGWSCIGDISHAGNYGTISWTAGTTYFILLDDEDTTAGTHQFFINCPVIPSPIMEYQSHEIDDDNITSAGDNDGLAEPGESIEMSVSLRNTGTGDAHNVSAVLSSPDPYIFIHDATNNFGDISVGDSATCSGDYDFEVSLNCPEKDVAFTLEITSAEGSWSDQFEIHVYNLDPTSLSRNHIDPKLTLYPNPTKGVIYLTSESEFDSRIGIGILDNTGRLLNHLNQPELRNGDRIEIDLSDYPKGMYFIQFNGSNLSGTQKIIKE